MENEQLNVFFISLKEPSFYWFPSLRMLVFFLLSSLFTFIRQTLSITIFFFLSCHFSLLLYLKLLSSPYCNGFLVCCFFLSSILDIGTSSVSYMNLMQPFTTSHFTKKHSVLCYLNFTLLKKLSGSKLFTSITIYCDGQICHRSFLLIVTDQKFVNYLYFKNLHSKFANNNVSKA